MDNTRVRYFRCPYCAEKEGGHAQRLSKSAGLFKVKELFDNVLIFECQRCRRVCRAKKVGSTLLWEDMSAEEKKVFKKERFTDYNKKGGKKK